MQNKRMILVMVVLVLLVGAAAFMGARELNQRTATIDQGEPFKGDFRSILVPAPELPTTEPEVPGPFVERLDHTIIVETRSLGTSTLSTEPHADARSQSGPRVEVVVTNETMVYRETTQPREPLSPANQTILQTVEPATLDDLDSQSMVMAWGRKNGDRVIADVLMFGDLVAVKSAIFEDCEICP
jgi:hypothetical protein